MKNFTKKLIGLLSLLFLTSSNLFAQEVLGGCQAEYTPQGYPSWYVTYGSGFYDCNLNCYAYYTLSLGGSSVYDVVGDCLVEGCMDPNAYNFNPDADYQNSDICIPKIYGCTDTAADNYDENAPINTSDSTMCEYLGCTDPQSQNYNESANTNDGSCISWAQIVADLESDLDSMMNNSGVTQADLDAAVAAAQTAAATELASVQNELTITQEEVEYWMMEADMWQDDAMMLDSEAMMNYDMWMQAQADAMMYHDMYEETLINCETSTGVTYSDYYLSLPQGWSIFGYTCYEAADVISSLSEIQDQIEIVKDDWGMAYIPDWGFNAIGEFTYGKGYQIKLFNEVNGFQFCPQIITD